MIRLGLTGSIATGKSTALQAFAALGVPVFSSDEAVHALYEGEAVPGIAAVFPNVVHGGKVDRARLASRLVAHPEELPRLEAVVHPLVRHRIAAFLAKAERAGAALAVVDIPLLYEGGHDYGLDAVLVTVVDAESQRRRALARPAMTVEKFETLLARQMPQAEKQRRATYVIDTSGPIPETAAKVGELVRTIGARPHETR
jgi:dephospho-CoA kinase